MTTALRVLLVEDSPSDAKLVIRHLGATGRPIEFERVEDPESMRLALERGGWDLVISDWSMPKFSARGALDVLKKAGIDLPFIIVSGTVGEDLAVDAMRAGAHDYVLKDKLGRLGPAVERELRECEARAASRRAQSRFQALIENSDDGIVLTSETGTLAYVSPAAERILGRPAADILGTNLGALVHPDDAATAAQHRQHVLTERGRVPSAQRRVVRPDGTYRWIEVTLTNLLHDPAVGAVVSNFRDVTDRRATEDALVVAQQRFGALFDSGIMGIIVSNEGGVVYQANDTFLTMLGYSREDLAAGLDWRKLTPPEWAHVNAATGEALRTHGRAKPSEKEYFRKDGTRVPVLVGFAAIKGGQVISVSIDIAERKRAAEALTNLEAQLRQAQKMEAVGRLAGGVAHDFNNVLSVILSYTELILGDLKPNDPLRADVGEISTAAARAAGLTRQLLLLSRQQVVEPKVIDLHDVLTDMDKMLQRILGEDVDLVVMAPKSTGRVKVDPTHVEQVVLNLVVNARDAMPTGGKLTIETANVVLDEHYAQDHVPAKAGAYVMLAVSDTGCGMDAKTRAHIFEPFFTTKEVGKGTGLGLSTVYGIVQQSGGNVWVYSEPGKGTTFKVYLPRVDAELDVMTPAIAPTTLRGKETILVVEDEAQVRTVVVGTLRRQGYTVIAAENAGAALLICERHVGKIDLLLTDVVMPQMSGPELAKRLATTRPETKLLCMSGYTDDSIVRHGVLQSGVAFIQKPITPALLVRKVREVMDAKG